MSNIDPLKLVIPEVLESERLSIRAAHPRMTETINKAVRESIEDLRPWMPWAEKVPTLDETKTRLESIYREFLDRKSFEMHFFLKGTNTYVGASGIPRLDWSVPKFEIGYWVHRDFSGQGYVTEAVRAINVFAFETLKAARVEIYCDAENHPSARVAERAGFELEGILRNHRRHMDGSLRDTQVYSQVAG